MSLDALPAEIISRICRFIGIEVVQLHGPELAVVVNRLCDFQSLRVSCKGIYHKTEYDAAVRYAHKLWTSEVCLDESSLRSFSIVSKVPSFRKRFREILFYNSYDPEEDEEDFKDEEANEDLISTSSMYDYSDLSFGIDERRDDNAYRNKKCQRLALLREFQASPEATDLMLGLFRDIGASQNLELIDFPDDFGYDLVLDALVLAKFSRKVVNVVIDPHFLAHVGPQSHWRSPHNFAHCVQGLRLQPYLIHRQEEAYQYVAHRPDADQQSELQGTNSNGLHVQGFRPTTPELNNIITTLIDIEYLELNGCRPNPGLRICHGCDDLFARNFAPMRYPHLVRLKISRMLISGGRLRAFIKHHAQSLKEFDIGYVTLTDGTWRSIAQGLAKLPLITKLRLEHLHQKHHFDHDERPRDYMPSAVVLLRDSSNIKLFLDVFVTYFRTIPRFSGARVTRSWPRYYEARLFDIPEAAAQSAGLEPDLELPSYAQMS